MRRSGPDGLGGSGVGGRATRRAGAAVAAAVAGVLLVTSLTASMAQAATARTWVARVGTGGANGTVVLALTSATAGSVSVALKGLPAATTVTGFVRRGTCAIPGTVVAPIGTGGSTSTGRFSKRRTLAATEAAAAARATSMIVTIRAGSFTRCAALVEKVAPRPTPTPAPTATPIPTPVPTGSPSLYPTPTPAVLPGVGTNVMVGGAAYLTVVQVDPFIDGVGATGVLVKVRFNAFTAGKQANSSEFRLRLPDGGLRSPTYVSRSDSLPDYWSVTLVSGVPYEAWLLFAAPLLGRLDLLFDGSFGAAAFHIRN
jgi:hypothetical protein